MASIFPEVAALAAVLAAPPGTDHLLSAVRHALGYAEPPNRHDIADALSIWTTARQAGRSCGTPPSTPTQATTTTAHRGSPTASSQPNGRPPPVSAGTGVAATERWLALRPLAGRC